MNKSVIFFALTMSVIFSARADYDDLYTFEKGTSLVGVNFGVKFIGDNRTAISGFYEYGISKLFADQCTLGAGIFGGYFSDKLAAEKMNAYIAGVRLNVHYQFVDGLDTYAGMAPNFNVESYKLEKDKARFNCYFHIGGRYYLNNWLGLFAEISTGYNNFSGGVSVKF